jgi:hypothetical protein
MYNSIRRERPYNMQTLSGQGSANNLKNQSRAIAVISIILFAIAGLLSGFAVSAFTRPVQQQLANNTGTTLTPPQQKPAHTPTATSQTQLPFAMNPPAIQQAQYIEIANESTTYNVTAQAVDKKSQSLYSQGITCKLWLTEDSNVNANMPASRLRAIDTLAQPFPKEVQGGLTFAETTLQTQPCNNNGQGQWSYTVSPSIKHGIYYLVVLMDWSGIRYNWSWVAINIKKGD